jgi:hypothetical protein
MEHTDNHSRITWPDPLPHRGLMAVGLWFFACFFVFAQHYGWVFHLVSIPFSVGYWALVGIAPFLIRRQRELVLVTGAVLLIVYATMLPH